ncbi:hypothetical protein SLEP1_g40687 [Rubroshorea leprosula]|uniref:Uncharacterized protein n=1 Tax=Rubroshorea leprosula TaxID=152421 RepID=A0AAV5L4J2_9ROSI|nr:hypothetical protein SLEP1_g40687 [Rubroshorea leprosula]
MRQWGKMDTKQVGQSRRQQRYVEWGYDRGLYKQASAFFFTNFPDDWSYSEMWRTFGKFGRVYAIYSPQRRNRNGKRFGFVRFLDVQKLQAMENQLDQIHIGSHKIWVNLAKYPVEENEPKVKEEDYEWLRGCYVGTARSIEIIPNLQEKLYMEGYFSCRLRPMGGKLVLMDCEEKEELRDLVQGAADWLGQWFIDIQPWTPTAVAKERFVWMRCQGAPLHAWGPEFFEKMAVTWGKFICLDDNTSKKLRFDVARFLISTQIMNAISVMRRIKVNGDMYDLKFSEEELVNSLFSTKHDFKPNFSTDSEYKESWTDCNDLELNHEENDWGVDLEQLASDGEEEGENRDFSQIDKRSTANPRNEVEFEFEEEGGDVKGRKLVDSFPSSRLGEEQSVEVVADSFDRSTEASDLGGRVEAGLFENIPQNELSSDPIESSAGNNLGLQQKPSSEATCQARDNEQQVGGQIWANQLNDTTKIMENESRIEQESVPQREQQQQRQVKKGESLGNNREFWADLQSEEESEKGWMVASNKDRKKRKKKRAKSCKAVYQKASLQRILMQREKNRSAVKEKKAWREDIPKFQPGMNNEVAGGSVGDSEGENFIGIEGVWGPEGVVVFILNVYSPCQLSGKRVLWAELKILVLDRQGYWCIAGDFNAVRNEEEKKGSRGVTIEMREFNNFIQETELVDIPLVGRKFTWYQSNGNSMSRIDRFLLSEGWLTKWSEARQWGLSRTVSDHCPILLKHKHIDWGPKPFKFFNAWFQQEGCMELIKEVWGSANIQGWAGFQLKEKLKLTKEALKRWSKTLLPVIDAKINKATTEIAQIDKKGEEVQLSEEEIIRRREDFLLLWESMKSKERTQIMCASRMKEEIASFFEDIFKEEQWDRPKLEGVSFKQISQLENDHLVGAFSEEEIDAAVRDCDSSKAPGPDGFNFGFVKNVWELIRVDVIRFLHEFHKNGKLVRGLNTSFIVLVPKVDNPQKIEEYRPISLIGVMYKILAKLLANRLKVVLDGIVGEQQMAFIRGRQLMDGVVVANEVIDDVKKKRKETFLFKIDFEKAFDKVSWEFLDYMMQRMGFCVIWRNWIMECLRTNLVSILVNGSPTRQFTVTRGLRQGDPLSPFLFLIIAEGLNGLVSAASQKGLLDGAEVGSRGFKVSHLQYADDTILFAKAKEENVWAMKGVLRAFELVSGLKINFNKSHLIGIHVQEGWLNKMSWVLCCKVGVFPFKYLGIPIGGSSRRKAFWKPLVELFSKKLSTWKGRYLSFGGRITLINSVLSSLPVFWMSVYLIPKGTILSLDKIRRGFLWGGAAGEKKINLVKWEQVCKGRKQGGLGVKDLRKFNIALLGKWWGRIVMADKGLWKKVIAEKYGRVGEPSFNWLRENMNFGSSWWRDLSRLNDIDKEKKGWLVDGLELKLGEGVDISFWWDKWSGDGCLANKYPRLYLLSTGKDYKISQMGGWHNDIWKWSLHWRRSLFSWEEHQELELLKEINEKTIARGRPDQRIWTHSKDGSYTTKSAYQILAAEHRNSQQGLALQKVWNPLILSKISAFSWQLLQGKIPTKDNLMKRGVIQAPGECRCELCGAREENSSHLFVQCKVARDLWSACYKWWGIKTVTDRDC